MNSRDVLLPGGLPCNGRIERNVRLKPLTGILEQALIELERRDSVPSFVSSVLLLLVESIGGRPVDSEMIDSLCAPDRQYLMLRFSAMLTGEQQWLEATCSHCNAFFDVEYRKSELPVKKAEKGFPFTEVNLEAGLASLRIPNAIDQANIVQLSDNEAMQYMLERCICSVDHNPPTKSLIENLSDSDFDAIDEALDKISPAVCNELSVVCPECGSAHIISLNHYMLSDLDMDAFYNEIHILAMHYHWGESEILKMSRTRRHKYLELIDRSRAMIG